MSVMVPCPIENCPQSPLHQLMNPRHYRPTCQWHCMAVTQPRFTDHHARRDKWSRWLPAQDLTEAEYQRSRLTVDAPQMKGLDAEVGDMASVGDNPFGDVQDTSAGKGKGKGTNVTLGKKKVAITSVVDGLKVRHPPGTHNTTTCLMPCSDLDLIH